MNYVWQTNEQFHVFVDMHKTWYCFGYTQGEKSCIRNMWHEFSCITITKYYDILFDDLLNNVKTLLDFFGVNYDKILNKKNPQLWFVYIWFLVCRIA